MADESLSRGLWQELPQDPDRWKKAVDEMLRTQSDEDRINVAFNYMIAHYANREMGSTRWQG